MLPFIFLNMSIRKVVAQFSSFRCENPFFFYEQTIEMKPFFNRVRAFSGSRIGQRQQFQTTALASTTNSAQAHSKAWCELNIRQLKPIVKQNRDWTATSEVLDN